MKIEIPDIFPVTCHTRHVGPGSTFVAIKGTKYDGHNFIEEARTRGAAHIVTSADYTDGRLALAQLSAQALNYPAKKLKIIGVTGTKGKSTTVYLLEHILRSAGVKTALLSTIKNKILDTWLPTELTTQQPDYLQVFFNECVNAGVEWVVMEVAAQAFTCHRVHGIEFDVAVFTNFSKEHGEFYATEDLYFADKQKLFEQLKKTGTALLNGDDTRVAACPVPHGNKQLYSLRDVEIISNSLAGLVLNIKGIMLKTPILVGTFNAYNMLAVYYTARALNISEEQISRGMDTFMGVPGRLQKYELPNGATAFIDYAHNPSSFEALFSTLRLYTKHLIVVFGCGGERDKTKRPIMGAIAEQYADVIILTSDNPRSEDPVDIIQDICAGIALKHKIIKELDRACAIHKAYELSAAGSIIVLLGKGPDEYQIIQGVKYPFSEAAILRGFTVSTTFNF